MTLQGVKRKLVTVSDFRFTGRLLGKGNFARVEEAVHNVLNVKVAIKIIDVKEIKEAYVIKNLHREARIMSLVNHPCIASLFQTMELAENVYYLVTELVSGGDLCSFIIGQRCGKLEERPARVYARQFASALAHMHSFGIVHRDLKMENVMLNSSQTQIKIVDFGLSNTWSTDHPLRTHCGSPEYAAPELFITGREYGPEVDLWSLGIIFYGMVVGQLPFVGGRKNQLPSQERRKRLVSQINKGLGTSQRQAVAPLSPEFRVLLGKLLTADPTKRITSKELLIHPWITEKGKKYVHKHPFKNMDSELRAKIISKLGNAFQVNEDEVIKEISENCYGRLGGMYNILTYKYINEQFNPDKIASLLPRKTEHSIKTLTRPKSANLAKSQHTLYNQCLVLLNKVSKQQVEQRAKSANAAILLSKNAPKHSRSKTDQSQTKVDTTSSYSKTNSMLANRRTPPRSAPLPAKIKNNMTTKLDPIFEKSRPQSSTIHRPYTAETTVCATKCFQRNSVATAGTTTFKANNQEFHKNQLLVKPTEMGDGYCPRKKPGVLRKLQSKDRLPNEPIARSIAGYLTKKVPDYMLNVRN